MAEGITLGSINTELIIQNYLNIWRSRYITPLETKKTTLKKQQTALSGVESRLLSLKSKIQVLLAIDTFYTKKADSSDTSVLTGSVTDNLLSVAGVYAISINQLAKQHRVGSDQYTRSGTDISAAEPPGDKTFRITINGISTDITVTVNSGDTNETVLKNMAEAINSSGAQATATVIYETPTTSRLVITAKNSGLVNTMAMQDVTGSLLLNSGVLDGTGAFKNEVQQAKDSLFTVDGFSFQRSSNTVTDAIAGVTINLLKEGSSANLTVSIDTASIQKKIEDFLTAYNEVITYARQQTTYDLERKISPDLMGNIFTRSLGRILREYMYQPVTGLPEGLNSLGSIGIESDVPGNFSIKDPTLLVQKLSSDPQGVGAIFNTLNEGVGRRINDYISSVIYAPGALYNNEQQLIQSIFKLEEDIKAKEKQMAIYEGYLRARFAALEKLLASNEALISYIQQRLSTKTRS